MWVCDPSDHNQLAPVGCVGELLIDGPIVARGYLGDPTKTRAAFVCDPAWLPTQGTKQTTESRRFYKTGDLVRYNTSGTISYVRRKDTQVKYHGQRVELGEIETNLSLQSSVHLAAVVQPKTGPCQQQLVALLSLHDFPPADGNISSEVQLIPTSQRCKTAEHVNSIEEDLRERLPEYMVPHVYVLAQSIPLTSNGKLDRRKMTSWTENMDQETYREIMDLHIDIDARPMTTTEKQLQATWARVLNIPITQIGLDRSFFSLGGDSITAMQIGSHCRAEGLVVTVQDILRYKTISQIAPRVKLSSTSSLLRVEESFGTSFDLSPIQEMYFQQISPASHSTTLNSSTHYNQSFFVQILQPVEADVLGRCLDELVKQHTMLRARLQLSADGYEWKQLVSPEITGSYHFQVHEVSQDQVAPIISKAQTSLDIENGPVFAVNLFSDRNEQYISMVAHHLVIDLVSWRIILGDLEELLKNGSTSQPQPLAFQIWLQLQADYIRQHAQPEIDMPMNVPEADFQYWGMGDAAPNRHADALDKSYSISSEATSMLFGQSANSSLRTEPVDIILAVLFRSFQETFTDRVLPAIYTEGHGRESWDSEIDISRTVGWFTTITPLSIPATTSAVDAVRRTKDNRRQIPSNGWPYFASRFLTENGKRFSSHSKMEIAFNYLGRFQQLEQSDSLFRFVDKKDNQAAVSDIGDDVERLALFDISVAVVNNEATISISYNRHMQKQGKIEHWIQASKDVLVNTIQTMARTDMQYTISDFPLLSLDYESLNKLQGSLLEHGVSLGRVENVYPCSPMQQGILLSQVKLPNAYWVVQTFELVPSSAVDIRKLHHAWQTVVDRHAMLRTSFIETSDQEGLYDQIVLQETAAEISIIRSSDFAEGSSTLKPKTQFAYKPGNPPHRLTIRNEGSGRLFCTLEISHALVDGASVYLIIRDLALAYAGRLPPGQGPLYSDYIAYLQRQPRQASIDYWSSYLENIRPCHLPLMPPDDKTGREHKSLRMTLDPARLQTFCSLNGVTLANLFQAAWALVLQRYTGSDDVCFGYLASGRDIPVTDIEDAVGPFINMLICRSQFPKGRTVLQVVQKIQDDFVHSLPYQHASLADIQHALKISDEPLFNTTMSLQRGTTEEDEHEDESDVTFVSADSEDPTEVRSYAACSLE
jgi:non-ribosomal peptide synthase protein (TIGR01720 family)